MPGKKWRDVVFDTMVDGEWHKANELFALIEHDIPAHYATRMMARSRAGGKLPNVVRITDIDAGRWRYFVDYLRQMGIERQGVGSRGAVIATTRVRLFSRGKCHQCHGDAFLRTFRARPVCPKCNISVVPPAPTQRLKRQMTTEELLRWAYTEQRAGERNLFPPHLDVMLIHDCVTRMNPLHADLLMGYGRGGEAPRRLPQKMRRVQKSRGTISVDEIIIKWDKGLKCHVKYVPLEVYPGPYIKRYWDDLYDAWLLALHNFNLAILDLRFETIEVI
jgi:hypothetical protein